MHPDEDDWGKLNRLLKYIRGVIYLKLTLEATSLAFIKLLVDASFVVHPYFRSHTSAGISLGKVVVSSIPQKNCINMKSSTEYGVSVVADSAPHIL